MHLKESFAQPGLSSQTGEGQTSREYFKAKKTISSSVTPSEDASRPPAHSSQDPETVDVIYKIVYSDRYEYSLRGNVYFRYNVPPERRSTGWFCIVAFHWHDVHAEFECIYHPSIKLFENFKPVRGSLKGGSGRIKSVDISMWNFADRGPDLNAKYMVNDDNGNRIMLMVMITETGLAVRMHGKLVREGEDENEVWLSNDERRRLRLRP